MESKYKQTINDFVDSTYKYDNPEIYKNDTTISSIKNILQKAEDYSASIDKPLLRFSKQDFIDLFNENKWVNGRSNFSFCKSRITRYLFYLHDIDTAASAQYLVAIENIASMRSKDLSDDILHRYYFGSENDFLTFIDAIPERFVLAKLAFLLFWLGFSFDEMTELTFDDMNKVELSVASHKASKEIYDRIDQLSHIEVYTSVDSWNRNRNYYVYDSKYLVRLASQSPDKENKNKATSTAFHIRVAHLYEYFASINSDYAVMELNAKRLALNNRFCIMYEYESETGIFPDKYYYSNSGSLPFSFSNNSAFLRFTEKYRQWRRAFHSSVDQQ